MVHLYLGKNDRAPLLLSSEVVEANPEVVVDEDSDHYNMGLKADVDSDVKVDNILDVDGLLVLEVLSW